MPKAKLSRLQRELIAHDALRVFLEAAPARAFQRNREEREALIEAMRARHVAKAKRRLARNAAKEAHAIKVARPHREVARRLTIVNGPQGPRLLAVFR